MAQLIRIGNSQGIRIPKPLIEQAMLEGKELSLEVAKGGGLLIRPLNKPRAGWAEQIQDTLQNCSAEAPDQEWLDASLTEDDWRWE
ncbi:MAG: AbrB/MazE/SpoVT family DNA-binding domain-containing protein [Candidatus Sericytochromatia bacterium]|nr:AbrB/MazE/SpoVT family DNA-binding domain-containing protein [Candidatus Sericytochromatia bacterium]